jgi:exoribonuclease II
MPHAGRTDTHALAPVGAGASSAPAREGDVFAFLEKGALLLGCVQGFKGASAVRLLCNDAREHTLPLRRVLGQCGTLPPGASRQSLLEELDRLKGLVLELAEDVDIVTLWEALGDETDMEPQLLARHWFGAPASAQHTVGILWAVLQESVHFKLKGAQIQAQPAEAVEQRLREKAAAERRERELRVALEWIGGGPRPEQAAELLAQLKETALFGAEAPRFTEVRDLLRQLGPAGHEAHSAFDALVRLGIWDKDENLELLREGVPLDPEPEVLEAARRAAARGWSRAGRADWTGRGTFSVDPASTRDVDDAITCWLEEDRLRVAVHITDVTELLEPESGLDLDARMRGVSIYLPMRVIPMLPPALSEQAASLLPGELRPAITAVFTAGPDGEPLDVRFELSEVTVERKLSYSDVDRLLADEPLLQRLLGFCQAHRQRRIGQGAVLLPLPEVSIDVDAEERVQPRLERDTDSHRMVAELMICFNALVARACHEAQVPALFRGQPDPRRRIVGAEPTLVECLLQRRHMLRSVTGLAPTRHSGLGLDAYTMATSPLRRYLDLCMQWQLKSLVRGEPPFFDVKKLEELLPYLSLAQGRAQRIERSTGRYWMHRWLEQLPEPAVQALWVAPMGGRERAALLPFLTEVEVDMRGQRPPRKGTLVDLEITRVHAREADLKLSWRGVARKLAPTSEPLADLLPPR